MGETRNSVQNEDFALLMKDVDKAIKEVCVSIQDNAKRNLSPDSLKALAELIQARAYAENIIRQSRD